MIRTKVSMSEIRDRTPHDEQKTTAVPGSRCPAEYRAS